MKKKIIILCGVCLLILIGAFIGDRILGKDYFIELNYNEFMEKIENKKDFILVLSQTTCSHCASYKPKIEEVAKEYKVNIYFIEVDMMSDDEKKNFKSLISFTSTPTTVFIENGEEKTAANRINGETSKTVIIRKLKSNGFID